MPDEERQSVQKWIMEIKGKLQMKSDRKNTILIGHVMYLVSNIQRDSKRKQIKQRNIYRLHGIARGKRTGSYALRILQQKLRTRHIK